MGLPKQLDLLVRGGDEYSLILANAFAEQKKRVLLVDEEKDQIKSSLVRLNYFEKRFLQELGKSFNIDALINIERNLIPANFACHIQNKLVSLASVPGQNAFEFKRKLCWDHDFIQSPNFDKLFFETTEEIFQLWFKEKNEFKVYLKDNKPILSWAKKFGKDLLNALPAFEFFLMGPVALSEKNNLFAELYSTFSFLGPNYFYSPEKLRIELLEEFKGKGGYYKKTQIYKTHKEKKEWVVELESFEGLVYSQNIYAGSEILVPDLQKKGKAFSSWEIPIRLNTQHPWDFIILPQEHLQGSFVPYAELIQVTSDKWIWKAYLEQPELAVDQQILIFLERSLESTLSQLPFSGAYQKLGPFERNKRADYFLLDGPASHLKPGIFSSLLRLRSVIMKA